MIEQFSLYAPDGDLAFDVVIVGAGPAGITLALELEGSGQRVAVLEGGDRDLTALSQSRYQGPLTLGPGLEYPPLDAFRLRYLGGTTGHWGGWCRPLEANVFAPRRGVGDVGWPFDRSELDPYYERAHEWCGLGRVEYDATTLCAAAGIEPPLVATDLMQTMTWRFSNDAPPNAPWNGPVRFGTRYIADLEDADAMVLLGANCVGLEVRGRQVSHVTVSTDQRDLHRLSAGTVVLAGGAIENVRQLLIAQAGGVAALGRSSMLGVGFADHPHAPVGVLRCDEAAFADRRFAALSQFLPDIDGTPFRMGFGLSHEAARANDLPNISFTLGVLPPMVGDLPMLDEINAAWQLVEPAPTTGIEVYARAEPRVEPTSRVFLSDQLDDLGSKRAGLDWRVDRQDLTDIATARRLISGELIAQGFGPLYVDDDTTVSQPVTGGGHHLGGVRMHESADHGVVDADGRCHALPNLYVAGSATFPSSCFSNPTLTIVAMAVRLAEHLRA